VWVGDITKLGGKKNPLLQGTEKNLKIRKLGFSSSAVPSSLHVLVFSANYNNFKRDKSIYEILFLTGTGFKAEPKCE
jgi:hypothetical protein